MEDKEQVRTPKRHGPGPGGPGMGGAPGEKAKNFKGAIQRLFQELHSFHIGLDIVL